MDPDSAARFQSLMRRRSYGVDAVGAPCEWLREERKDLRPRIGERSICRTSSACTPARRADAARGNRGAWRDGYTRLLVVGTVTLEAQWDELHILVRLLERVMHACRVFEVGAPVLFAVDDQHRYLDIRGVIDR